VRYVYGISSALLIGGAAISLATGYPAGAQVAQNDDSQIRAIVAADGVPANFADLTEQLQPAVVNISTRQQVQVRQDAFFDFFRRNPGPVTQDRSSLGSGFLISSDGYVVTNNHVIALDGVNVADSITITLFDDRVFPAVLVGRDPYSDIAVLKVATPGPLPYVTFGDSQGVRAGDWVIAIGNPFGLGGTVTSGIVSSPHRRAGGGALAEFIQTDASINSGNSGGPMFDMNGHVIGINDMIVSPNGGNVGIGFAIPSEIARPIVEQIIKGEEIIRGFLGVQFEGVSQDLSDALGLAHGKGELIAGVVRDEAADKAGIEVGDIVLKINGTEIDRYQSAAYILANIEPGTRIKIELLRRGEPMTIEAMVSQRPDVEALSKQTLRTEGPGESSSPSAGDGLSVEINSLGLSVMTVTPQISSQLRRPPDTAGVVVSSVEPGTNAAAQQLTPGIIITSVNYEDVTTAEEFRDQIARLRAAGRQAVLLNVLGPRGGGGFVTVRFKAGQAE
jgi:serine protease Do